MCHGRVDVAAIYSDSCVQEVSEGSTVLQVPGYSGLKGGYDLGWKAGEAPAVCGCKIHFNEVSGA